MTGVSKSFTDHVGSYADRLSSVLRSDEMSKIELLARAFARVWRDGRTIYLCGNGGSAGNANHLANDFTYGVGVEHGVGICIESLSANPSVLTCLGNDIGYDKIYSEQVRVKGREGDVLVVFSGSGNSANVVEALKTGNDLGMETFAILGYSGGTCKALAQTPIHFAIDDMQVAEDMQLVVGHLIMQWLCEHGPDYGK